MHKIGDRVEYTDGPLTRTGEVVGTKVTVVRGTPDTHQALVAWSSGGQDWLDAGPRLRAIARMSITMRPWTSFVVSAEDLAKSMSDPFGVKALQAQVAQLRTERDAARADLDGIRASTENVNSYLWVPTANERTRVATLVSFYNSVLAQRTEARAERTEAIAERDGLAKLHTEAEAALVVALRERDEFEKKAAERSIPDYATSYKLGLLRSKIVGALGNPKIPNDERADDVLAALVTRTVAERDDALRLYREGAAARKLQLDNDSASLRGCQGKLDSSETKVAQLRGTLAGISAALDEIGAPSASTISERIRRTAGAQMMVETHEQLTRHGVPTERVLVAGLPGSVRLTLAERIAHQARSRESAERTGARLIGELDAAQAKVGACRAAAMIIASAVKDLT